MSGGTASPRPRQEGVPSARGVAALGLREGNAVREGWAGGLVAWGCCKDCIAFDSE